MALSDVAATCPRPIPTNQLDGEEDGDSKEAEEVVDTPLNARLSSLLDPI